MNKIIISLALSFLLALFAYIKKAMTKAALLVAFIFSIIITYFGGIPYFIILCLVFIGTIIAGKIKKEKRKELTKNINEKTGKKDIFQIIANVGIGTFSIIMYGITNNIIYLVIYSSVMAESLADTLASDIGILSRKEPINIKTLKKGTAGLSGNISLLGLFSSLFGSLIIGLIFFIFNTNIKYLLTITICGFLGALFDSYLGAIFQVKYKCSECKIITELKEHCNKKTKIYNGNKKINNDLVNFLSNIFAGLLCLIFLHVI